MSSAGRGGGEGGREIRSAVPCQELETQNAKRAFARTGRIRTFKRRKALGRLDRRPRDVRVPGGQEQIGIVLLSPVVFGRESPAQLDYGSAAITGRHVGSQRAIARVNLSIETTARARPARAKHVERP